MVAVTCACTVWRDQLIRNGGSVANGWERRVGYIPRDLYSASTRAADNEPANAGRGKASCHTSKGLANWVHQASAGAVATALAALMFTGLNYLQGPRIPFAALVPKPDGPGRMLEPIAVERFRTFNDA